MLAAVGTAASIAIVAIAIVGGESGSGSGDRASTSTTSSVLSTEVQRDVDAAFGSAALAAIDVLRAQQEWRDGTLDDAALAGAVFLAEGDIVDAVERLASLPHRGTALSTYQAAADLYVEWLEVAELTVAVDASLRQQADLGSRRVVRIADRTYDHARSLLLGDADPLADIDVQRGPAVPDWEADGLSPGSPLFRTPAEEEPAASGGPPDPDEVRDALEHGDAAALVSLGHRFDAAQAVLAGSATDSDVALRLAMLAAAEGCWMSALGLLEPDSSVAGRLTAVGADLLSTSNRLWTTVTPRLTMPDSWRGSRERDPRPASRPGARAVGIDSDGVSPQ